jgi:hypothetical protein
LQVGVARLHESDADAIDRARELHWRLTEGMLQSENDSPEVCRRLMELPLRPGVP